MSAHVTGVSEGPWPVYVMFGPLAKRSASHSDDNPTPHNQHTIIRKRCQHHTLPVGFLVHSGERERRAEDAGTVAARFQLLVGLSHGWWCHSLRWPCFSTTGVLQWLRGRVECVASCKRGFAPGRCVSVCVTSCKEG